MTEDEAFYAGVLTALAVVHQHDAEVIYREIMETLDQEELIAWARKDELLAWSGLIHYGYVPSIDGMGWDWLVDFFLRIEKSFQEIADEHADDVKHAYERGIQYLEGFLPTHAAELRATYTRFGELTDRDDYEWLCSQAQFVLKVLRAKGSEWPEELIRSHHGWHPAYEPELQRLLTEGSEEALLAFALCVGVA